jgi:hypothetical protein
MATTLATITANLGYSDPSNVFEPQVMLPTQFFGDPPTGLPGAERKLMAALLSDGIEAFVRCAVKAGEDSDAGSEKSALEAIDWVDNDDQGYVFSFSNVCYCLGINPDYLRIGLHRYVDAMKDRGQTRKTSVWKKIRRPRKR